MLARRAVICHPDRRMKKRFCWQRLLVYGLLAVGLYIMLRWFEYHQVYHPGREFYAEGGDLGVGEGPDLGLCDFGARIT